MPLDRRETEDWLRPAWSNTSAPSDVPTLLYNPLVYIPEQPEKIGKRGDRGHDRLLASSQLRV
uniref:Uncharacterized protein n=1 Tax=Mesocestoides corti TaxID=53468 RepID=A0A5K3FED9_MESCO